MDIKNILSQIEQSGPEAYEKRSDRRNVLKSFGGKVALAALPLALGSLFTKASARSTDAAIDALNFALQLEYFEYNFYHTANNVTSLGLIPAADQPGFLAIEAHEKAHIDFLVTTITNLGGVPYTPPYYTDATSRPPYVPKAYDYTGQASTAYAPVFHNVFSDYPTFLIAAQTFEDSHIRAVNGIMNTLAGTPVFAQVQRLLAAEGRHAGYVRLIRRKMAAPELPASWINNNIPPASPVANSNDVLQPFYNGEENITQLNVNIAALQGATGNIPALSASAAFDEPLTQATVLALLAPFLLA